MAPAFWPRSVFSIHFADLSGYAICISWLSIHTRCLAPNTRERFRRSTSASGNIRHVGTTTSVCTGQTASSVLIVSFLEEALADAWQSVPLPELFNTHLAHHWHDFREQVQAANSMVLAMWFGSSRNNDVSALGLLQVPGHRARRSDRDGALPRYHRKISKSEQSWGSRSVKWIPTFNSKQCIDCRPLTRGGLLLFSTSDLPSNVNIDRRSNCSARLPSTPDQW